MIRNNFNKFLLLLICFFYLSLFNIAFAISPLSQRNITFTNNTSADMQTAIELQTDDSQYKAQQDWRGNNTKLSPYATTNILNINTQHLKKNKYYYFIIHLSNTKKINMTHIVLDAKKNDLNQTQLNLYFNDREGHHRINFDHDNLTHYPIRISNANTNNSQNYLLHLRRYLSIKSLHHDYHIVLDHNKPMLPNSDNAKELHVLTYNTILMPLYVGVVDKLNHPGTRANYIPDKISNYDIVIAEELFDRDFRNKIILLMTKYYPYHSQVVGYNSKKILSGGVMIFSKWPILAEDQTIYRAGNSYDKLAAKGALYVKINKKNKIYHFIGTHLQSSNSLVSIAERGKQLIELEQFISNLNIPRQEPLLISGDFNVNEFSPELKVLLDKTHSSVPPNCGDLIYSCDAHINTMMDNLSRVRLDFILVSKDHVQPLTANNHIEVFREFYQNKLWPDFDLSDHFAVAGEFVYP